MQANETAYHVDGEVGRFEFVTHSITIDGKCTYNSGVDCFVPLRGKEWYQTRGFKSIALVHGASEKSYRKSSEMINRIRHQEDGGTPSRTLRDNAHNEGMKLVQETQAKAKQILSANGFTQEGKPLEANQKYGKKHDEQATTASATKTVVQLPQAEIEKAIEVCQKAIATEHNLSGNPVQYEEPNHTVNITIDDVCVKKQKEERGQVTSKKVVNREANARGERIQNTVLHAEHGKSSYVLNAQGVKHVFQLLVAFLLNNDLLKFRIQFFTDGYLALNDSILSFFSWHKNIAIILDWYHLEKKCKEQLSLALKGRELRNQLLDKLLPLLWHGLVEKACLLLENIPKEHIKNSHAVDKLLAYLRRNIPYIPCYAVRKELGLRNSSSIGEKMNDILVSSRQKHNGMSWSKPGSLALATLSACIKNQEAENWFRTGRIDFILPDAA